METPHRVYLGLGSNQGNRLEALRTAIRSLAPIVMVDQFSSVWDTAPEIVHDQPRYLNAVIGGWTVLDPLSLLRFVKRIERDMGRGVGLRYGPRPIDIDILIYDDLVMQTPELVIPHPLLVERVFALAPLAEIAPDLKHPALGKTITELLSRAPRTDVVREDTPLA